MDASSKEQLSIASVALQNVIKNHLPVSYERCEADGYWRVEITEEEELILDGYAMDCIQDKDWKNLPLSELAYLVESIQP